MTTFVQRLTFVLAAAALATPALSEPVRASAGGGSGASYVGHPGQLSTEGLSATVGGAGVQGHADLGETARSAANGPTEASAASAAERLAAARKAIDQVLATLPAHKRAG